MKPEDQKKRSRKQHINGMQAGNTCIDCHKGIAHKKAHDRLSDEELTAMEKPDPDNKRPIPPQWQAFIDGMNGDTAKIAAVTETAVEPVAEVETESEAKPAAETESTAAAATTEVAQATTEAPATATTTPSASASKVDWSALEAHEVTLFYPGQPRWSGC